MRFIKASGIAILAFVFPYEISSASCPHSTLPQFPVIKLGPKAPEGFQIPNGPNRRKVCTVSTGGDAGPKILAAARDCNRGGTVYFPEGSNYTIATALDLTFLDHVDFAIYGYISFQDNVNLWPNQTFKYPFQAVSLWWRFGGTDVNIYGGGKGTIDGKGNTYWSAMTSNKNVERPSTIGLEGLHRSTLTGLKIRDPPGWTNFIGNSSNVLFSDFDILVKSTNTSAPAKNTDAFDTYRSSNIVIQNSVVINTDDCVSFKPNSSAIIVQGLNCTGSHGMSVGSLGQYPGEVDIVEHVYVYNTTMRSSSDGARIKVWAGAPSDPTNLGGSGGGSGRVHNITYEHFVNEGNDHAIALTQCYYAPNQTWCNENPSKVIISGIKFLDFSGVTSKRYDPRVGELRCSQPDVCTDLTARNITVTPISGKPARYDCVNIDLANMDIPCVTPTAK